MRIIAGSHRGKKLIEYYNDNIRPTTDRVKENVFNLLSNYIIFKDLKVLDLFAGIGAYGIECLSRGAKFVQFNDVDKEAIKIIKKNLGTLWTNYKITNLNFVDAINESFDLIFLDPPYDSNFAEEAIELIKSGIIVFETDKQFYHPNIFLEKKYGRTIIYFLKK